jgi:hypothetical protein
MNWRDRDDMIVLAVYHSRLEAEVVLERLRSAGLEGELQGDDGGGMLPFLQVTQGVALYVPVEMAERAAELLEEEDEG